MERCVCIQCGNGHAVDYFNRDRSRASGRDPRCKDCTRRACKRTYEKHHDKHVALKRRWKDENRERHRETSRLYQQLNPDRVREGSANYRARWRRATPPWVDLVEIKRFYANCPPGHHVDHIYPLAGENFSGLNVPWNLQYLPAEVHYRKGRRPPVPQEVCYL